MRQYGTEYHDCSIPTFTLGLEYLRGYGYSYSRYDRSEVKHVTYVNTRDRILVETWSKWRYMNARSDDYLYLVRSKFINLTVSNYDAPTFTHEHVVNTSNSYTVYPL